MFRSMRSKVLMAVVSVTGLATLLIILVFYWKSSNMIEENYGKNVYARVRQMGDAFDESLKEIYYLTVQASCDENLLSLAQDYLQSKDERELEKIADKLRDYSSRYSDMGSAYLILPDEQVIVTSKDYPVYVKRMKWEKLNRIARLCDHAVTPAVVEDPVSPTSDILSFASRMENEEGKLVAYIMNNMDERVLYYKYLDSLDDKKMSKAVILDGSNRIVSTREQKEVGELYFNENLKNGYSDGIQSAGNSDVIGVIYRTGFTGYHFYMETEKSEVLSDLKAIRYFLAVIFLMCLGLVAVIAYFITRAIYQPLKNLTDTMELVSDGNLKQRVEVTSKDEIGTLSRDFNYMLGQIEELIERLVKEEMLKKDAELEALQYQITPHFMYNTLNSIKYAALLKGEKEIGGLVEDFIELLQASINKKGAFVTVAEELHFLDNYVSLQQMRYEGKLKVLYEIDSDVKGYFLPRLLLQPLVENAILHGLDMKKEDSRIVVAAEEKEGVLWLTIEDNGRGMTREQMDSLLTKSGKKTSGLSGIGVANIRERLTLYYGEKGGLSYESSETGTRASVYLPASREQGEYAI